MHSSRTKKPLVRHMAHLPASPLPSLLQGLPWYPLQPLQRLPQPQLPRPLGACLQLAVALTSGQAWAHKCICLRAWPAGCLAGLWPQSGGQ